MNERVKKQIEIIRQGYIDDPNRILSDYRKEIAEISGYHGRELLELLQNAVDELGGATNRSVAISLKDNELTISNNGNVFSFDGFVSLMYSNLSPKHNKNDYIGSKGTGFRSILNWSEGVRIYSGDLSVEFSALYAEEMLTELQKYESVRAFCGKHEDVHIATLVAPKSLEPLKHKDFDTVIIVKLKPDITDMVVSQLEQINSKTLLFLEKLEYLILDYQGSHLSFEKTIEPCEADTSEIKITSKLNGKTIADEHWTIISRGGFLDERKYWVMIAYREDMSVKPDVLYSFFRTKVQFPVPALVHATFDLSADRNHLTETVVNEYILKVICDTLVDLAINITTLGVDYAPLLLLSTVGDFPNELSWGDFSISKYYLDAIAASKIFPTVNGEYISFEEMPRFYESDIASMLFGPSFPELMLATEHHSIQSLITAIAKRKGVSLRYSYSDIVSRIDALLPSLTLEQRAKLWFAFIDEYRRDINPDTIPRFALDTNGNPVLEGKQAFLPAEGIDFPVPPDFTKIVFLNRDLVSALRTMQGTGRTLRSLALKLDEFGIKEYNLINIVNTVIARLRNREHQKSKKTRACYEATLEWLWKLWNQNILTNEMPAISSVPIINRLGVAKNADELYFGSEFGNDLMDKLLTHDGEYFISVPNPKRIAITPANRQSFIDFLTALGVAFYPRKKDIRLRPMPRDYLEQIYNSIKGFPIIAEDDTFYNIDQLHRATFPQATVLSIDKIEDILKTADTKSILSWLRNDESMWQCLSEYEPTSSKGFVRTGNQQNNRQIAGNQLASYIRYVFATSKWIEVDGVRYSPSQCILANKIGTMFAPLLVSPPLESFVENENKTMSETSSIRDILARIGVASDYSELGTGTFYMLLLKLPDIDENGEISKAIYNGILKSGGLKKFNPNDTEYRRFLHEGKVFCKSSKDFKPISEVHYLTEKTVSKEILKGFELIAIPSRQSQENVKRYFGVPSLKLKQTVKGEPLIHPENNAFEQDYNDFLCYAFCRRVDIAKQSEISTLKSLRVQLCTHIEANYDDRCVILGENTYIRGKNIVYVQAPDHCSNIKQLKSNVDFCSSMAELFMSTIDIQDDTLFSYVRSLYEKEPRNRNALILHDFDDLSILERSREALNKTRSERESFVSACFLVGGESVVESLKSEIDKIDFADFKSNNNAPIIIDILKVLKTDVDEFNDRSEVAIDLRPYYQERLKSLSSENEECYKNSLLFLLSSKTVQEKRTYLKQVDSYRNHPFIFSNTIHFDYTKEFKKAFGPILEQQSSMVASDVWRCNRVQFLQGKDDSIVNELLADAKLESLLYFGCFDELEAVYSARVKELERNHVQEATTFEKADSIVAPIVTVNVVPAEASRDGSLSKSPSPGSRIVGMKRERNTSDQGFFAEKLVYWQLKKKCDSVVWVSENSKKAGINPEGIAGLGYDIKYTNNNGQIVYIEVKSTTGTGVSFIISESEFTFAENHAENYEVILVSSVMSDENRKVYRLPNLFSYADGEDRLLNSKFSISGDNYTIRCQVVDSANTVQNL